MHRKILNIVFVLLTGLLFVSCFTMSNEPEIPSEREETDGLKYYLEELENAGNDIDTTDLGIYYVVLEEGEGAFPASGDSLEVGYAGYYTDGTLFDASDLYEEDGTFSFVLEDPPMIPGWDNGMKVINKNAKVQLILPSKHAYGATGQGNIPPYKTLIFVVKMIDIKPAL